MGCCTSNQQQIQNNQEIETYQKPEIYQYKLEQKSTDSQSEDQKQSKNNQFQHTTINEKNQQINNNISIHQNLEASHENQSQNQNQNQSINFLNFCQQQPDLNSAQSKGRNRNSVTHIANFQQGNPYVGEFEMDQDYQNFLINQKNSMTEIGNQFQQIQFKNNNNDKNNNNNDFNQIKQNNAIGQDSSPLKPVLPIKKYENQPGLFIQINKEYIIVYQNPQKTGNLVKTCLLIDRAQKTTQEKDLENEKLKEIQKQLQDNSDKFSCDALIGYIHILDEEFLLFVKRAVLVSQFLNHYFYQIQEINFIPLQPNTKISEEILEYQEGIKEIIENSHYFSYTYDLSQRLQINKQFNQQNIEQNNKESDKYKWNLQCQNKLDENKNLSLQWKIAIIQGYIGSYTQNINDLIYNINNNSENISRKNENNGENELKFYLISRRQFSRGGPRYIHRGADKQANVANFVETEQIIVYKQQIYSFVQIRGSLPLLWDQNAISNNIVINSQKKQNQDIFKAHFQTLQQEYQQTCLINLLARDNSQEIKLIEKFEEQVELQNLKHLNYKFYDFHKNYKQLNETVLDHYQKDQIQNFGYFHYDQQQDKIIKTQKGIFRTNCKDCLDRTNIYMMKIGMVQFYNLIKNDIKIDLVQNLQEQIDSDIEKDENQNKQIQLNNDEKNCLFLLKYMDLANIHKFIRNFKILWANSGDKISLFYAGTNATTSILAREGDKSYYKLLNKLEGYKVGIKRFIRGVFLDDLKQECIEIMLEKHDQTQKKVRKQLILDKNIRNNQSIQQFKTFCINLDLKEQFQNFLDFPLNFQDIFNFEKINQQTNQQEIFFPDIIAISVYKVYQFGIFNSEKTQILTRVTNQILNLIQQKTSHYEKMIQEQNINLNSDFQHNIQYKIQAQIDHSGHLLLIITQEQLQNQISFIQTDFFIPTQMDNSTLLANGALMAKIQINKINFCFLSCNLSSLFQNQENDDVDRWEQLESIHEQGFQKEEKNEKIEYNDFVYLMGDFVDLDLKKNKTKDLQAILQFIKQNYNNVIDRKLFIQGYNEPQLQIENQSDCKFLQIKNENSQEFNGSTIEEKLIDQIWNHRIYYQQTVQLFNQENLKYFGGQIVKDQQNQNNLQEEQNQKQIYNYVYMLNNIQLIGENQNTVLDKSQ